MHEIKSVSPKALYPMTTIESINPDTLERVTLDIQNGADIPIIRVIEFGGYNIIWDGNYEMIAANIIGKSKVNVEIVGSLKRILRNNWQQWAWTHYMILKH